MAHLRAPVFLRLRDDIDPKTVRTTAIPILPPQARRRAPGSSAPAARGARVGAGAHRSGEIEDILDAARQPARTPSNSPAGPHRIRLTHLDRVYWPADEALQQPALTKRDLLRYLAQVSPLMLPHLADRPLTMIRMPDGIHGQRFFQKHWTAGASGFAETVTVYLRAQGRGARVPAVQQPAHAAVAGAVGHAGIPRLAFARAGRGPMQNRSPPTTPARSKRWKRRSSTTPTTSSSTSTPTSIPARKRRARNPSSTPSPSRRARRSPSPCASCCRAWRWSPSSRLRARPACTCSCRSSARSTSTPRAHVSELVSRHLMRLHPKDITMEWSVP